MACVIGVRHTMLADGKISPADLDLLLLTDSPEETVEHILHCQQKGREARRGECSSRKHAKFLEEGINQSNNHFPKLLKFRWFISRAITL